MAEKHNVPESEKPGSASFEDNLRKLEEIVHRLEEGNLALEESLRLYEEGIEAMPEGSLKKGLLKRLMTLPANWLRRG